MANNIDNFMTSTISKLKDILDIDSIIGEPIKVNDNVTILPICKMTLGVISGGSDVGKEKIKLAKFDNYAGGSGTGVSYQPIGIVAVVNDDLKFISLNNTVPYFEILETIKTVSSNIIKNTEKVKDAKNKK